MCGIFGAAFADELEPQQLEALRAGVDRLVHRGPDHGGEALWKHVFLGHRRLSIIDLSEAANQPLHAKSAPASLVFNGEIYNYRELIASMPGFESASDSETLLEGYLRFGMDFFQRLRGIYAFAIFDRRDGQRLVLGRDPAGVKPLYFHRHPKRFLFGSEIKALTPALKSALTIDERVLKAYLHLGYCPEPHTIYREIECVRPGHVLDIDIPHLQVTSRAFLNYDFLSRRQGSQATLLGETGELLQEAVDRNLVADVPLTLSLSGGIDSSLIFSKANDGSKKHEGLTVRFSDGDYDESPVAKAFADHVQAPHQIVSAEVDGSLDLLNKVFLHFDQPYADSSALPFYFLARAARQQSKVLIGGDGGDEVHDGYLGFGRLPQLWRLRTLPGLNGMARYMLKAGAGMVGGGRGRQMRRLEGVLSRRAPQDVCFEWTSWLPTTTRWQGKSPFRFDPMEALELCRERWESETVPIDVWIRRFYFQQRMGSDYLRKADMMSMIHGLEYRVPMLDEDLVQHGLSLNPKLKANGRVQKRMLRELHQQTYPPSLSKRPKTGFTIPLDTWLGEKHIQTIRDVLLEKSAFIQNWIDPAYLKAFFEPEMLKQGTISRAARYQRLLIFYNLENWYRNIYATR